MILTPKMRWSHPSCDGSSVLNTQDVLNSAVIQFQGIRNTSDSTLILIHM